MKREVVIENFCAIFSTSAGKTSGLNLDVSSWPIRQGFTPPLFIAREKNLPNMRVVSRDSSDVAPIQMRGPTHSQHEVEVEGF